MVFLTILFCKHRIVVFFFIQQLATTHSVMTQFIFRYIRLTILGWRDLQRALLCLLVALLSSVNANDRMKTSISRSIDFGRLITWKSKTYCFGLITITA